MDDAAVFTEAAGGAVRFVPLPPPTPEDVARIATLSRPARHEGPRLGARLP